MDPLWRDPPSAFIHVDPADPAIMAGLQERFPNLDLRNLCGETRLKESLNILAAADDFRGMDSGRMHFVRRFGIQSVSYWGPTHPNTRLKPVPGMEEETLYRRVPSSPCIHVRKIRPAGGTNICIQNRLTEEPKDGIGLVEASGSPPGDSAESMTRVTSRQPPLLRHSADDR